MRALLTTALVIGIVWTFGCKKQKTTEDLASVPPNADFDAGPVYGSDDIDTGAYTDPEPVRAQPEPQPTITPPEPEPVAPRVHVVARGETLWRIAVRYYGDGQRWRDIVAANGNIDPKKLAVGQRLVLP